MRSKIFPDDMNAVFEGCITTLERLECTVKTSDFNSGIITASKAGGHFSYGHSIKIKIKKVRVDNLKVNVISNSVGIPLIYWRKNSQIEVAIIAVLTLLLK